jgi:hypothetical protein
MQRAILIAFSFGLFASSVAAQPADEPVEVPVDSDNGVSPYFRREYARVVRQIDPRQTQQLVQRWKDSKDAAEREKLETELRGRLKLEFTARLARHYQEIKELEEKVRQLRERLALRKEKQEEIVGHRLQQILREAQGLGWDSEGVHGNAIYQSLQATDAAAGHLNDLLWPPAAGEPLNAAEAADDILDEATSADPEPAPSRP